jgi:hypothetical protein
MKITAADARRMIHLLSSYSKRDTLLLPEVVFNRVTPEAMEEFEKAGIKVVKDCRAPIEQKPSYGLSFQFKESTMQAYIGSKIVRAEPMTDTDFVGKIKPSQWAQPTGKPGYHVQYAQPDGSRYDSWSPKAVFEEAYRPVSDGEKEMIR